MATQSQIESSDERRERELWLAFETAARSCSPNLPSEVDVARALIAMRSLTGKGSLAAKLQRAVPIRARALCAPVLEETSRRYVLKFRAVGSDHDEQIRSERTDCRYGSSIVEMFSPIREGDLLVIYKCNEPGDERHSQGYRVAPYVRRQGMGDDH
ncbi:MAG: hypothetical protein Q4B30_06775 [Coriobacteriaceae bacterium]|nr:hypothetical protein [Coriobacteriaceae bacterium]